VPERKSVISTRHGRKSKPKGWEDKRQHTEEVKFLLEKPKLHQTKKLKV